jgi:molybdate transport system substrate-binding protein
MLKLELIVVAVLLTACSGSFGQSGKENTRTLTVLAASSLTGTYQELANLFEAEHPGVQVKFSFDSSATLAQQAAEGAPADILATADEETMQNAADAGAVGGDTQQFAENQLVLVTPTKNPAGITTFSDISGTDFVTCVETAPCGKVATALLRSNRIETAPVSHEVDAASTLAKVVEGEADAGLVFTTDAVSAASKVMSFDIPGSANQRTNYFVARLAQSDNDELARAWMNLLTSEKGQQILADSGFLVS